MILRSRGCLGAMWWFRRTGARPWSNRTLEIDCQPMQQLLVRASNNRGRHSFKSFWRHFSRETFLAAGV